MQCGVIAITERRLEVDGDDPVDLSMARYRNGEQRFYVMRRSADGVHMVLRLIDERSKSASRNNPDEPLRVTHFEPGGWLNCLP